MELLIAELKEIREPLDKEILFTGYDIYTHSELLAMHTANMETLEMAYRAEASQV